MAEEGTGKLGAIYHQIKVGDQETMYALGRKCNEVLTELNTVIDEMPDELAALKKKWTGPASTAFNTLGNQMLGFVEDTSGTLKEYQPALVDAGDALKVAKDAIQDLADQWNDLPANQPVTNLNEWEEAAQEVLDRVSEAYAKAGDAMKEIPADPGEVDPNGNGADEDGDEEPGDEEPGAADEVPEDGGAGGAVPEDPAAADDPLVSDPAAGGAPGIGNPELNTDGDGSGDGELGGGAGAPTIGGLGNSALTTEEPAGPDDPDGTPPPELRGEGAPTGDPATKLTSFNPDSPSPATPGSLISSGSEPPTTLTNAPNAVGGAAGAGGAAGSAGSAGGGGARPFIGLPGPGSQLTSAGPRGRGGASRGAADGARGVPLSPFGPGGAPSGVYGRGDDAEEERETWLIGDEEWDDSQVVDASIGRPLDGAGAVR